MKQPAKREQCKSCLYCMGTIKAGVSTPLNACDWFGETFRGETTTKCKHYEYNALTEQEASLMKELVLEKCPNCGKHRMVKETPRGIGLAKGECSACGYRKPKKE